MPSTKILCLEPTLTGYKTSRILLTSQDSQTTVGRFTNFSCSLQEFEKVVDGVSVYRTIAQFDSNNAWSLDQEKNLTTILNLATQQADILPRKKEAFHSRRLSLQEANDRESKQDQKVIFWGMLKQAQTNISENAVQTETASLIINSIKYFMSKNAQFPT